MSSRAGSFMFVMGKERADFASVSALSLPWILTEVHYWVLVQWTRCSQSLLKVLNTTLATFLVSKFLN